MHLSRVFTTYFLTHFIIIYPYILLSYLSTHYFHHYIYLVMFSPTFTIILVSSMHICYRIIWGNTLFNPWNNSTFDNYISLQYIPTLFYSIMLSLILYDNCCIFRYDISVVTFGIADCLTLETIGLWDTFICWEYILTLS